ncbi:MAG: histidine kinase N-terminal 7TM domain-containing protein [Anaerolineales bacterium]|jgi:hypothetical protein
MIVTILIVVNQILNAGNSITAFSLLLYSLTFNLRERVAQTLALLMGCVTIVYFADVLVFTAAEYETIEIWLRIQWIGISFLPATIFHFSDALLAATGRPSRGRRHRVIWLSYFLGAATLLAVAFTDRIAGELVIAHDAAYLMPGILFPVFVVFFAVDSVVAVLNLLRAYRRTLTTSSRRRMRYLLFGALAPMIAAFPFLMVGQAALAEVTWLFWGMQAILNVLVAAQLVLMAYTSAYFGVSIPDRVVKSRLFQWILRGPVVASTVLAVTVIVNRIGLLLGIQDGRSVSFTMVVTLLLLQYVITLIRPTIERLLFYGRDRGDVIRLQLLEERLLTSGDVRQFLEAILNAACDVVGVHSAFIAIMADEGLEMQVSVGPDDPVRETEDLPPLLVTGPKEEFEELGTVFVWNSYWLLPIRQVESTEVIGIMGLSARSEFPDFDEDETRHLSNLVLRASVALADLKLQQEVFSAVDRLVPQVELVQVMRAASRYSLEALKEAEGDLDSSEQVIELVKDALGHYWGGPRLTESPLLRLNIVRQALDEHEGNPVNALRAVLKRAIEQVRPEGERRFTAEWMLYNILEMKFLQGRKVRDVALRLAMSEADLYRKQRVALEAVGRAVAEMERGASNHENDVEAEELT